MLIKAKHHWLVYSFFKRFSRWGIARHFHKVIMHQMLDKTDLPVLVIANHISWWDGFWVLYLNELLFKRKFHVMMLFEQLKKYWLLNYTGAYSVKKNSRSVVESLAYTVDVLKDNRNLVLMFPQGEIQSMHTSVIRFEKGVEKLMRNLEGGIQLVFMVSMVDYFSNKKPSLYLYLQDYKGLDHTTTALEQAYNQFYEDCINYQNKRVMV